MEPAIDVEGLVALVRAAPSSTPPLGVPLDDSLGVSLDVSLDDVPGRSPRLRRARPSRRWAFAAALASASALAASFVVVAPRMHATPPVSAAAPPALSSPALSSPAPSSAAPSSAAPSSAAPSSAAPSSPAPERAALPAPHDALARRDVGPRAPRTPSHHAHRAPRARPRATPPDDDGGARLALATPPAPAPPEAALREAGLDELLPLLDEAARLGRNGDGVEALARYHALESDPRFARHVDLIAYERARLQGLVLGDVDIARAELARLAAEGAGHVADEAALTRCEVERTRAPCAALTCLDDVAHSGRGAASDAAHLRARWAASCPGR